MVMLLKTDQENVGGAKRGKRQPTSQNPSRCNPSWLTDACVTRKGLESEWLARDNPETNPITIKPETASHVAEQFSWVPLPCCSPPGRPFPIKSLALSARVSSQTIHFWVLDKTHSWALEEVPLPAIISVTFVTTPLHRNWEEKRKT